MQAPLIVESETSCQRRPRIEVVAGIVAGMVAQWHSALASSLATLDKKTGLALCGYLE
jgi:hypothetical protein